LSSVVLLNPESGEVYAPYDGGADLFLKTPERVAESVLCFQSMDSQVYLSIRLYLYGDQASAAVARDEPL